MNNRESGFHVLVWSICAYIGKYGKSKKEFRKEEDQIENDFLNENMTFHSINILSELQFMRFLTDQVWENDF